jgi:hypothetical protein
MNILALLVILILIGVVVYLVPMDPRFKTLIYVIVLLLTILSLADAFFGLGYGPRLDGCARPVSRSTR